MFCWCTVVRYFPVIHILFQKLYSLEKCDRRMGDTKYHNRVWIIASHFANCEVNCIYCDCNVVNHEENAKQFFSQGELNSSTLCFSMLCPNDIHVLFIRCILLPKGVLLILKITSQNTKNISQFLKKTFTCSELKALLRSAYLLRSEFQTIIQTLQKFYLIEIFRNILCLQR